MSQLFAIVYDDPDLARRAADQIRELARGRLLSLRDMVVVTRADDGTVKRDPSVDLVTGGALGGAFWGGLIGLIFMAPLAGAAGGAAGGALSGWLTDYGVDDDFIREAALRVKSGRAAVFVLADDMIVDEVASALGEVRGELIYSSLTANVDAVISAALAGALHDGKIGILQP
ncbi:DUF1269 domain-containing protein [Siculibacillus lacustris]|uniref:DUF1269 domain-containing protein n=1 Tax=Siculibacillus lacustris TaxID=1549641 RepID=A0A4Q9VVT7_9HYPH|nr:DUF1269 domain-containing protein [Siculibacillus lacustris]TBW40379.1 DUF1269 domain-containing protein [Siculibacillus lacustris]